MAMHNPPHPGEFIAEVYLKPNDLSGRELAAWPHAPHARARMPTFITLISRALAGVNVRRQRSGNSEGNQT